MEGDIKMIKESKKAPEKTEIKNIPENRNQVRQIELKPGDILVDNGSYLLRPIVSGGAISTMISSLAETLAATSAAGYELIQRFPANATENILIFKKYKTLYQV